MMCQSSSTLDKAQDVASLGRCDVQVPGLDQSRFIELSGGTPPSTREKSSSYGLCAWKAVPASFNSNVNRGVSAVGMQIERFVIF